MLSNGLLEQLKDHDVFLAARNHGIIYTIVYNDTLTSNQYNFSISECNRPPLSMNACFQDLNEIKPIIANMEHDFRFYDRKTSKEKNIAFTFNVHEEMEKRNVSDVAQLVAQLTKEIGEQFPKFHVGVNNMWPLEPYIDITVQFQPR